MYLFVHTKHHKRGPFSVARLKMELPVHNRLAYNRVHKPSSHATQRLSSHGCSTIGHDAFSLAFHRSGCETGHHMRCVMPPLTSIPTDRWFCHGCMGCTADIVRMTNTNTLVAQGTAIASCLHRLRGLKAPSLPCVLNWRLRATMLQQTDRQLTAHSTQHTNTHTHTSYNTLCFCALPSWRSPAFRKLVYVGGNMGV